LEGFYEDDKSRIEPVLQDFSKNLPDAKSYGVAISDTLVCLSAIEFEDELEKDEILEYFAGVEERDLQVPEIFEDVQIEDEFVAVAHNGSSYVFLSIEDSAISQVEATETISLYLMYIYSSFNETSEITNYYGQAELVEDQFDFVINSQYSRLKYSEFTVLVLINNTQNILELTDLVVQEAECGEVTPPRGVSSFNDYPVEDLALDYGFDIENDVMRLIFEKFRFDSYNFAVAPDIFLYDVNGFIVVEYKDLTCGYETVGSWDYETYQLKLTVFDRNSTGDMEASGVFLNIQNITVEKVDQDFYQKLFPENSTLFPEFLPEDPSVIQDFRTLEIFEPLIELYFLPDTGFNIYGKNSSFQVEVLANRVNETVETVVHSFSFSNESAGIGYEVIEQGVYYSSNDIDVSLFYSMASMFDVNRGKWTSGIWLEVEVDFNEACEENEYCKILKSASGADESLVVQGYMLDDKVYVDSSIPDFQVSSLQFEEAGLMIENSVFAQVPTIIAGYYLRTDSHTVLRVEAEIMQGQDLTALVEGESYQVWPEAFDVDYLNVVTIFINITVFPSESLNATAKADAIFGISCYNGKTFKSSCLPGTIDVLLDIDNYLYNSFSLFLYNLTSHEFFNVLLGFSFSSQEDLPMPYNVLSFETGLIVNYEYSDDFLLAGGVKFAGVYSELSGTIKELGAGDLKSEFKLEDFYFAESNGRMSSASASLKLDRESDYSQCMISGYLHMWDVETESFFEVSDNFSLDFSGFIYDGSYNYSVHLEGINSASVTEAEFTAKVSLVDSSVSTTEEILQSDLKTWLDSGLSSINHLNSLQKDKMAELEKFQAETCDASVECPTTIYCKDRVDEVCDKRKVIQTCQDDSPLGCLNVELQCIDSNSVCIKNSSCSEDCDCLSVVTVCKQWKSVCREASAACTDTYLQKDPENCEKNRLSCETEEILNKDCRLNCEYSNQVYQIGVQEYENFEEGYNKTFAEVVGYLDLQDLINDDEELKEMVKVFEMFSEKKISESGVGPYDFNFQAKTEVISVEFSDFVSYILEYKWDFFNSNVNAQVLTNTTRDAVIDLSGNRLSETLSWKSPFELIEENIND
jgi:hypothetical protein